MYPKWWGSSPFLKNICNIIFTKKQTQLKACSLGFSIRRALVNLSRILAIRTANCHHHAWFFSLPLWAYFWAYICYPGLCITFTTQSRIWFLITRFWAQMPGICRLTFFYVKFRQIVLMLATFKFNTKYVGKCQK